MANKRNPGGLNPQPVEIARRLRKVYGRPTRRPSGVLEGLVRTILSQNTASANAEAAWQRLRARFPDLKALVGARLGSIEAAIRPAGLATQRARFIRDAIRALADDDPSLRLEHLAAMPTAELLAYLQRLPGVGPKTAACVALFQLGRAVFPVDTHIARIARRLGWADRSASPERIQALLEPAVPPPLRLELHVNLIAHGRQTCRARSPRCTGCCLADLCPSASQMR